NIPNSIDPALRRPGRFDRELEINVPNKEGRLNILKIHTRNMPMASNMDINLLKSELNISISQINILLSNFKDKHDFDEVKESSELKELEGKKKNLYDLKQDIKNIKSNKELKTYLSSDKNSKNMIYSLLEQAMLRDIADITYGFVGADLSALAKEAGMILLRRILPDLRLDKEEPIPKELLEKLKITMKDFKGALKVVRPSAMREVLIDIPKTTWEEIGGLESIKQELEEAVEWPLKHPDVFKNLGITPPKGILLYGPPGTGKTLIAKAIANDSKVNFISIKGPEMLSKWVNETPELIKKIFKKGRQVSPSIIFLDEIDSIASARHMNTERISSGMDAVNQLLTEMDGIEEVNDLIVIAATNRPDIIDPALMRPGRFDRVILTPAPNVKSREEIFKIHTKNMPLKSINLKDLATKTEGYVGADIEAVCREAAILALRKDIKAKEVNLKHFEEAIEKVPPSITKEIEKSYEDLRKGFSSATAKQMQEEKPAYMG
ncbi:AAA family ATPase, partial [Candidatus Woesearchaeota archaeon]|nr:AAA family ATPase [Candidatus Woesearchaeota archaeon]